MKLLPFEYAVRNLGRSPLRLVLSVGGSLLVVMLVLAAAGFIQSYRDGNLSPQPDEPASTIAATANNSTTDLGSGVRQREYQLILDVLRAERGRRKEAADKLGISPRTLRYKLAQMRDAGLDIDLRF